MTEKKRTGFALLPRELVSELGRKGGHASSGKFVAGDPKIGDLAKAGAAAGGFGRSAEWARECGRKGGLVSPSAFQNNRELAKRAGSIGGRSKRKENVSG